MVLARNNPFTERHEGGFKIKSVKLNKWYKVFYQNCAYYLTKNTPGLVCPCLWTDSDKITGESYQHQCRLSVHQTLRQLPVWRNSCSLFIFFLQFLSHTMNICRIRFFFMYLFESVNWPWKNQSEFSFHLCVLNRSVLSVLSFAEHHLGLAGMINTRIGIGGRVITSNTNTFKKPTGQ